MNLPCIPLTGKTSTHSILQRTLQMILKLLCTVFFAFFVRGEHGKKTNKEIIHFIGKVHLEK